MSDNVPAWIAEAAGTAAVVLVVVIVAVVVGSTGSLAGFPDAVVVAVAAALTYGVAVAATLPVSGGHLNPAVTVAALATGRVDGRTAGRYLAAQVAASLAVGVAALVVVPSDLLRSVASGAPQVASGVGVPMALAVEASLTFVIAAAYWGVAWTGRGRLVGAATVGAAYLLVGAVAAPWTGAAVNPVRAVGPLVAGAAVGVPDALGRLPLYVIGPVLGALVAATLLDFAVGVPRADRA